MDKVTRITSTYKGITKFGLDEEGNRLVERVKYQPIFYIDSDYKHLLADAPVQILEHQRATYDGKIANKVVVKDRKWLRNVIRNDSMLPEVRDHSYMADLHPEHNYIMEEGMEFASVRRIWYFDIETHADPVDDQANKPHRAEMPVTSIQIYDNLDKKYYVFGWHPEETKQYEKLERFEQDDRVYFLAPTEKIMMNGFVEFMRKWQPDVITGWYSEGYDIPYIINRLNNIGLDAKRLSPTGWVNTYTKDDKLVGVISGVDHIDMIDCLKDLYFNLPNWKLATAAKTILGDGVADKLDDVTWRDWLPNFKGFIQYGIRDVEILKLIDEKVQIFDLYFTLQNITKVPNLQMLFSKSMVVDSYVCYEYRKDMVFPTRKTIRKRPYAGAYVFQPTEPGKHKDVFVCDYASLYPTTIMAFNLSPDTFVISQEIAESRGLDIDDVVDQMRADGVKLVDTGDQGYDEIFGGRYIFLAQEEKEGLIPKVLRKLYAERVAIKNKMKRPGISPTERNALDKHQNAVKLILNSAYGAMGFNFFRLCSYEAADACTFYAREALKTAANWFEERGHKTLYGDTDSVFVKGNNVPMKAFEETVDEFNSDVLTKTYIDRFHDSRDDEFVFSSLEVEKDLEYIYFGDVKKRYYSIVRGSGKKYIRGMNVIRKDTPEFLKHKLDEMAEKMLRGTLDKDWLEDLKLDIETRPLEEIGVAKAFSKPFDSYNKTVPYHVKGALLANKYLGTQITHFDNPYLFYIKNNMEIEKRPRDRAEVICLRQEDLRLLETRSGQVSIDWQRYFSKQVLEQLDEFNKIPEVKNIIRSYRKSNDPTFQMDIFDVLNN